MGNSHKNKVANGNLNSPSSARQGLNSSSIKGNTNRSINFARESKLNISANVATWNRDSHGLFDYESSQLTNDKVSLRQNSFSMWRYEQHTMFEDLKFNQQMEKEDNDSIFAVCVIQNDHEGTESAWLYHRATIENIHEEDAANSSQKAWRIIKHLPNKSYKIGKGDTLKFGRVRFRVVKM
jgi:hypothetical protein